MRKCLFTGLIGLLLLAVAVACGSAATAPAATAGPAATTAPAPTTAPAATRAPAATTAPGATTAPAVIRPTNTPYPTATSVPTAVPVAKAKYGGRIRMSAYADSEEWDPLGSASLSSIIAYSQLYNQVVQFDSQDTTKIVCDLCTKWDVSNGGLTFTFSLNTKAKWHDGKPLTAQDVVYSMQRYMDPKNKIGRAGLFRNYTKPVAQNGVRAVDDKTVEFNLAFSSGAFLGFLAFDYTKILPQHILEQGIDLRLAENIIKYKTESGPFLLDEYQRGNVYRVSKNPNYFKEGRPFFDKIDHFIIVDTGTLFAQFKAGQLEMMNGGFSNLSPTEYLQLDKETKTSPKGHVIAHEFPGTRNWGLMINIKKPPFTDPRVRKAIYLAINHQQLNKLIEDGTADTACPMMGMGYTFEVCAKWPGLRPKDSPGGKADIAYAKKLMADAGYPKGFTTKYDVRQVGSYPDTCTVVKQQLADTLGIKGEITVHESAAGYAVFATSRPAGKVGDWELACQGEGMTVIDADAVMSGLYLKGATRNYTDWETPTIRNLFEIQKVTQAVGQRRQILEEIEDYLVPTEPDDISLGYEDNHWVTLYWGKFFWLVHEDIRGFNPPQTVQYGFKHEDLWLNR